MDLTKLAVWWLTQADYEAMGATPEHLPKYIQDEMRSLNGRPGRGRLWVSPSFVWDNDFTMKPAKGAETIERWTIIASAGGIVIEREHITFLQGLPGLVTTLSYERFLPGMDLEKRLLERSTDWLDEVRAEACKLGCDFYKLVVAKSLGIPYDAVTVAQRNSVKQMLFAYSYGIRPSTSMLQGAASDRQMLRTNHIRLGKTKDPS